ncbi:MAG: CRISPR-associated endonuclease Cas2 [Tannerella sp.]|jgi:CRISPR-associated protein Cas2|nr:CRISPR-associated endonuclease Cas2 [Tannerella sp.]
MSRAKRIFCVIAYDIQDDRMRAKVSKLLEKNGYRINYSVFECMLTEKQYNMLQKQIESKIDAKEDTVVYYPICVDCFAKIMYQPRRQSAARVVNIV